MSIINDDIEKYMIPIMPMPEKHEFHISENTEKMLRETMGSAEASQIRDLGDKEE